MYDDRPCLVTRVSNPDWLTGVPVIVPLARMVTEEGTWDLPTLGLPNNQYCTIVYYSDVSPIFPIAHGPLYEHLISQHRIVLCGC